MTPVGQSAREHIGRLHRPPARLSVGAPVELRMVGRHLGPGRVDLSCRIVALYHHDLSRDCEVGVSFRVAVIRAMQRGQRRNPRELFGDLSGGRIPTFDGVVGSLSVMSLADLLQTLEVNLHTAMLEVQSETGDSGMLWTESGKVLHARLEVRDAAERTEGLAAFFALLNTTRGMFRLRFGVASQERTIDAPVSQLLLEGLRLFDEGERALSEVIDDVTDPGLVFNLSISDEGTVPQA